MAATKKAAAKAATVKSAPKKAGTTKAATAKSARKKAGTTKAATAKAAAPRRGALAAGAARASGERAKRRSTPLIQAPAPATTRAPAVPEVTEPTTTPAVPTQDAGAPAKHRPQPVAKAVPSRKAVARSGARTGGPARTGPSTSGRSSRRASPDGAPVAATTAPRPTRVLKAVPDDAVPATEATIPTPERSNRSVAPGVEELLTAGIAAVRVAAEAAGISPEDVERHLASMLSYVRRRITGDYAVDEFGFDEDFTRHFYLPVLRPLYRSWFRVEVRGIENIPATGGGLVVANHSGTIAMDSLMTQVAVHDEHPAHRHLRMMVADLVFQTPVVGQVARKSGSTLAANPDAERLLSNGELCGVWREGF